MEFVSDFKCLEIMFDTKLNFFLYTEMIKNKVKRNLGFIKRTCGSFLNLILKILYCSLVRSNFEYCSLIWLQNKLI